MTSTNPFKDFDKKLEEDSAHRYYFGGNISVSFWQGDTGHAACTYGEGPDIARIQWREKTLLEIYPKGIVVSGQHAWNDLFVVLDAMAVAYKVGYVDAQGDIRRAIGVKD